MKKTLIALALLTAACGGDDVALELTPPEPEETHVSQTDDVFVWAAEFGAPDDLEFFEQGVAVSHERRTVYALDCERGEELVAEGAAFGAVAGYDTEDGTYVPGENGYTNLCRP